MIHKLFIAFKALNKRLGLSAYWPLLVLVGYTFAGAAVFRHFELEKDIVRRQAYRVLKRMLEIQCMEKESVRYNNNLQTRHTKEALYWLIDFLNLTQVIEERSEQSPWSWIGALFYSCQLSSTIGYGLPVANTEEGRWASMVYILFGIPIFLLFLKDVGKVLSRALRKLYKRMRSAKKKLPDARRMSAPVQAIYNLSINPLAMLGQDLMTNIEQTQQKRQEEEDANSESSDSTSSKKPTGILKKPADGAEVEGQKPAEEQQKTHKKKGNIPIALALTILIIWIVFSSALFCLWEHEWTFGMSIYFYFVSISTVGLGDIMLVNFILILIGLALLSMSINLIQDWIERLIEQLLQEYIEEIEKIAAVVTNGDDFVEDSVAPFEVGMTDALTVPLTTIAHDDHRGGLWEMGRTAKDWVADKIASNLLIERLDPHRYSDDESSSSESSGSESETDETEADVVDESLKEVVVDNHKDTTNEEAPLNPALLGVRKSSHVSTSTRGTLGRGADAVSRASTKGKHKKEKKHKKPLGLRQWNPLFAYNMPTIRAIQAIETVKARTNRDADLKSRIFAKFATNPRITRLVHDRPPPPTKMVSFSVQTSPIVEQRAGGRPQRIGAYANVLGSMDSFSSGVNANNGNGNDSATLKSFDIDSLCSSAYYDVHFGGYASDSIPHCLAGSQQNTPPMNGAAGAAARPTAAAARRPTIAPAITFDRSSGSPPDFAAPAASSGHRTAAYRRFSTVNCLPIPTTAADRVRELPLLHSRMPVHRCPSCSNVATDTPVEAETVQRVHDICGIMPSDFLQHHHKQRPARRPESIVSDYDNTKSSASPPQSLARAPADPTADRTAAAFKSNIPKLRRSKRLDDSGISGDVPSSEAPAAADPAARKSSSASDR
ncbi:TWiK family of potassium channels protein 12 [Aphelenchoides fujianensis]|nr:TWiK family of potassium channels protein 12 [Aphelenchoides fujianensis]